jgi:hypothetical protein
MPDNKLSVPLSQDDVLSEAEAAYLADRAVKIRALRDSARTHILQIGEILTEVRNRPGMHGHWIPWLDREFAWSESTALRFMRVYEFTQANPSRVTDLGELPIGALYALGAPSTPPAAITEVLEQARVGSVTAKQTRNVISRHRDRRSSMCAQAVKSSVHTQSSKPLKERSSTSATQSRQEREKAALKARRAALDASKLWWANADAAARREFAEHVTLKNFATVLPRPDPVHLAKLVDDPKATGLFRCLSQVISPELEDRDRIEAAGGLIRLIEDTGHDAITVISAIVNTIVEASRALERHG